MKARNGLIYDIGKKHSKSFKTISVSFLLCYNCFYVAQYMEGSINLFSVTKMEAWKFNFENCLPP